MPAEPLKAARLIFKSGSQFDVLTRMPVKEIIAELEYIPSTKVEPRDSLYIRLEGCTQDDEPTPFACHRSELAAYAIIPFRPNAGRMAGGLIQ